MKKKILFILHLPPPVHGASMVGEYVRSSRLVNENYECRFINLGTAFSLGEIGKVSLGKLSAFAALYKKVCKSLKDFKPDLVYVTASSTGLGFMKDSLLVGMIKRKGFPVVVHFHNKGVSMNHSCILKKRYTRFFDNVSVIMLSGRLYSDIAEYVPRERVSFCPNGVDDPGVLPKYRHEVPHILFLSNLIESKGLLVLLDACVLLKERGVPFVLDIAGGETAEISAERLFSETESRGLTEMVCYHGSVAGEKKDSMYLNADIFTLPSYNDCFPLVVLEAMAHSLPVVSTDEGAIPDIVEDGVTGFVIERRNPEALSKALEMLLCNCDKGHEMGKRGREEYERSYTINSFENRFVSILNELCSDSPVRF